MTFENEIKRFGGETACLLWAQERGKQSDTWENRQIWLRRNLRRLAKPFAVFATNDQAAVEVIEACMAEQIAVPDDVAVLGMLDMHIFRDSTTIPLSSITVDFDRVTGVACDLLADMMAGKAPPEQPIRYAPTGIAVRRSTDTIAAGQKQVAKAIQFMREHYAEPLDSDRIAEASAMSKSGQYAAFKKDLGQTPYVGLTRIRVDEAKLLLRDTIQSVQAVAEVCGFGDSMNLYRNFLQLVGQSPAPFRKGQRQLLRR